ncbi:MAG TPA: PEP-CTERM sorting domain-containing protein [Rheinheimera sp.]|uniref:PEP-CTERM sorting domain-containing protein n=1 Tax=Rheinheimera sp. TaxID=1869214 RepID=UPI002F956803
MLQVFAKTQSITIFRGISMLKSILFAVATVVLSSFALPQTAQATPIITQDFLLEDGTVFGTLSVDINNIDELGNVLEWEVFELFGLAIGESFEFVAMFDPADLFTGFSYLYFDVNEVSGTYAFQGFWDTDFGLLDIYTPDGQFIDQGLFVLSAASVNVPEPGTMFLLLASVGGLLLRRRV